MTTAGPRTMVHLLNEQASRLLDRPALWTKRGGTWLPTSWREYAKKVKHFALGLLELGVKPKDAGGLGGGPRRADGGGGGERRAA
jgi:long-subunit acyl-CoA synthetase (AMP-forming)